MSFQVRRIALLTGAGFTRNFGGFLAKEMWARLFNYAEIQNHPSLVQILRDELDYEAVYQRVMYDNYSLEEQSTFTKAITRAYEQLDEVVCEFRMPDPRYPVNIYGVNKLIREFSGKGNVRGYFFTLNQDLFIDRRFRHGIRPDDEHLTIPGLPHHLISIGPATRNRALSTEDYFEVPTNDAMEEIIRKNNGPLSSTGRFHYVKLHGSMNWLSSDGRGVLVIGRDKSAQIDREPLLKWYFETFRKILSLGYMNLFITGYGFRDTHINEVIAESIVQFGLRWHALYPIEPENLKQDILESHEHGQTIWGGLAGYHKYELKDIYPADQRTTPAAREIENLIRQIP